MKVNDPLLCSLLIGEPSLLRKCLDVYNITIYRKRCMWMIYFWGSSITARSVPGRLDKTK